MVACGLLPTVARAAETIDFNRDVRPLLSDNCFSCHGFDESSREADLRLDTLEGATTDLGGYAAIVPGDPDNSELILRIAAEDADALMPPPDSHKKPLSAEAIETLRQWIRQGAPWGKHWSFESPRAAEIDKTEIHPVDYFVGRRLADAQLSFAPPAAPHTLARRLAFDLTGLPPTADELAELGDAPSDDDWERWIERLLASPHYGERMAMWWLDGARYADTDGFQQDATRQNWPWRDWVIDAFNQNKPFDEFTIEQFAGDLLPEATAEQKLATCFHRNHMHNGEGGRDPAESRVDYVLDRTNTMGTLWMGLTLGCTQCHDHKFDPISQQDYYGLTAFFNSIDETGQAGGGAKPFLKFKSPYAQQAIDEANALVEQTAAELKSVEAASEAEFVETLQRWIAAVGDGFQPWHAVQPAAMHSAEGTVLTLGKDHVIEANDSGQAQDDYHMLLTAPPLDRIAGVRLEVFTDAKLTQEKYSYAETGEFLLTNVKLVVRNNTTGEVRDIALARATASVNGQGVDKNIKNVSGTLDDDPRTGWTTRTKPVDPVQQVVWELREPLTMSPDETLDITLMHRSLAPGELIAKFRLSLTDQRGPAVRSLKPMPMQRLAEAIAAFEESSDDDQAFSPADLDGSLRRELQQQFREDHRTWQAASQRHSQARQQLKSAQQAAGDLNVTVLAERQTPRKTHILVRGIWDQHGEEVQPSFLPMLLPPDASSSDAPLTRLDLARWVVDRRNPLTARVITNQVWQLFFGAGLVRTPSDFGLQGESPTHPELLDWLAVDFMEHDWDVKHLVRRIVTSRTYRQDSAVTVALLERDPENRLLARGARFRLPAWMIRDAALRQSGLLNPMLGGPPVFPYQPEGIWNDQFMGRFTYRSSIGPAQYRRTVYAFWRRSSAPTFLFDNAMRRTCEVIPRRTNTPLQALTLMNNRTAREAARQLAENVFVAAEHDTQRGLVRLFRTILSRQPSDDEQQILKQEYSRALAFYQQHPEDAIRFTTVGQLPPPTADHASELAAGMLVANLVLNLDESITHE